MIEDATSAMTIPKSNIISSSSATTTASSASSINDVSGKSLFKLVMTHGVRAHDKDINTLAVSPNDAMIATGSQDKSIRLWRASDLTAIGSISWIPHPLGSSSISHVSSFTYYLTYLPMNAFGRCDSFLVVIIASLTGHKRGVWKVAFSPVDKCLASSSADRTVRLWSMADHSCLKVFEGHTASVLTVRFINKGNNSTFLLSQFAHHCKYIPHSLYLTP